MVFLVVSPSDRREFGRQNDEMPVRPLVDVILYWFCSVFGGLFTAVASMALVVRMIQKVEFDRVEALTVAAMLGLAPLMFAVAYHCWRKLNH
ncbi:MAG TPA: hypothetical protein VLV78_20250 [Thermoanaerobaculia bacterium]|nr:hypothetical protein [Thermoanaerobaculia bacterium]